MSHRVYRALVLSFLCALTGLVQVAQAQSPEPATPEEMQRALNAEVMAYPFNPGDIDKAKKFADEALKKGTPPVKQAPAYWQRGWDCGALTRYRHYYYDDYRNCIYYHRYYGHYW